MHKTELDSSIEELIPPTSIDIYKSISYQAEEELARPGISLFWSGVTAGLSISISVIAKALLHLNLEGFNGEAMLSHFGYCVGFIIVILGRMQLFTENTITPILPLLTHPTKWNFLRTARIWGIVFLANMCGALFAALLSVYAGVFNPEQVKAITEVSLVIKEHHFLETLLHGIPAGLLIAVVVWLMPSSKGFELWIIIILTYLISLGGFSHVIAGSVEAFVLLIQGLVGLKGALIDFLLPALIGNVIGGTGLFALLSYARIKEEIK